MLFNIFESQPHLLDSKEYLGADIDIFAPERPSQTAFVISIPSYKDVLFKVFVIFAEILCMPLLVLKI